MQRCRVGMLLTLRELTGTSVTQVDSHATPLAKTRLCCGLNSRIKVDFFFQSRFRKLRKAWTEALRDHLIWARDNQCTGKHSGIHGFSLRPDAAVATG